MLTIGGCTRDGENARMERRRERGEERDCKLQLAREELAVRKERMRAIGRTNDGHAAGEDLKVRRALVICIILLPCLACTSHWTRAATTTSSGNSCYGIMFRA